MQLDIRHLRIDRRLPRRLSIRCPNQLIGRGIVKTQGFFLHQIPADL